MTLFKYSIIFLSICFVNYCFGLDAPIPDNKPLIIYSENFEYYVVSVPKKFNGIERYAAVFKTETKELVFKVDSLYTWDLKVSNDGNFIYSKTIDIDSNTYSCYIEQYSTTSKSEKHFIYTDSLTKIDSGYFLYPFFHWELYKDRVEFIWEQKQTILKLQDFSIQTIRLAKDVPIILEVVDWKPVLPFELDSLKNPRSSSFSTDLISYLGYKSGYDRKMTVKNVFIRFVMLEDGTFSDLSVFAQNGKLAPERIGELDKELIKRIEKYISKYKFSKETVPDGVPYWYYSGRLYLVK